MKTRARYVRRIDALLPDQEARMESWADEWIARGLSTERADWTTFERAARECYAFARLAPPRVIVRCPSPLVAMLAGGIADQIIARLAMELPHDAVRDAVGGARYGAVGGAVDGAVRGAVDGAVRDAVRGAVDGAVDGIRPKWSPYIGGQLWLSWQAYESFFHEVCGLDSGKRAEAEAYRRAQSSACWWIPYRWGIMASDRPTVIHTEQVGPRGWSSHRMHCETGPAIAWPDGFALWMWHGVRVPQHVIEAPESITLDEIRAEENAEIRRIMRERYGESRYLVETRARLLDADYEGARHGAAPRALIQDDEGQRWLVGTDGSTSRTYHMPVDSAKTCREAHEELCGFPENLIVTKS